jgi:hypothetical protein
MEVRGKFHALRYFCTWGLCVALVAIHLRLLIMTMRLAHKCTRAVPTAARLVLFLRNERAPIDTASCERVLPCLDLFALGTLVLALLVLIPPQIKNGSVCDIVALRIADKTEQLVWISIRQILGKNCTETEGMIKMVFGEDSMSRTQVFFFG